MERLKVVKEAEAIRGAGEARKYRRQQQRAEEADRKDATPGESAHHRRYRANSQERAIDRAVSEFGTNKKRLYRADGSKVYGEEEHAERLGKLTEELRERVEAVSAEATEDAEGYEREALALSYVDPSRMVGPSDRGRLEVARPFVKEDCEGMPVAALAERSPPSRPAPMGWRRCCTPATGGGAWRPWTPRRSGSPRRGVPPVRKPRVEGSRRPSPPWRRS